MGVLPPKARHRGAVVGHGAVPAADPPPTASGWPAIDPPGHHAADRRTPRRNWTWAPLMAGAFELELLCCKRCGGRLRLIATLLGPERSRLREPPFPVRPCCARWVCRPRWPIGRRSASPAADAFSQDVRSSGRGPASRPLTTMRAKSPIPAHGGCCPGRAFSLDVVGSAPYTNAVAGGATGTHHGPMSNLGSVATTIEPSPRSSGHARQAHRHRRRTSRTACRGSCPTARASQGPDHRARR